MKLVKTSDKYNVFGDKTLRYDHIHNSNELFDYLEKKKTLNQYEKEIFDHLNDLKNSSKYDAFCADRCLIEDTYDERRLIKYLTKRFEIEGENADFIRELTISGFDL